jgi:hypothetical protein
MRFESHKHASTSGNACAFRYLFQHALVTEMNTIERADRNDSTALTGSWRHTLL